MIKRKKKPKIKKSDVDLTMIVDADIVVYSACCNHMKEVEVEDDQWTYHIDLTEVKDEIDSNLQLWKKELSCVEIVLCFGSKSNFRKRIMLRYKAHRTRRKPLGYCAAVEWCKEEYNAVTYPHLEADDVAGILHTSPDTGRSIVVSEDKDYLQLPGYFYNPARPQDNVKIITEEAADYMHLMQTLTGDTADGYKGCPGIGPKKASDMLKEYCGWDTVLNAYKNAGLTEKDALEQARVARILRYGDYDPEAGTVELWTP